VIRTALTAVAFGVGDAAMSIVSFAVGRALDVVVATSFVLGGELDALAATSSSGDALLAHDGSIGPPPTARSGATGARAACQLPSRPS
jgi:hypothetical protein